MSGIDFADVYIELRRADVMRRIVQSCSLAGQRLGVPSRLAVRLLQDPFMNAKANHLFETSDARKRVVLQMLDGVLTQASR